ncbi:transposase [Streptomyces sp. NPDC029004]|uniref:transposase n=1 Tax=Streptomyces sp. NPDC029004 TaxID=3154490 RepID=UPI0033E91722
MALADAQAARIEPLLPDRTPKRGGRWRDRREVMDAIAFKFRTGTQWVYLPEKYGNWRGVYNRRLSGPTIRSVRANVMAVHAGGAWAADRVSRCT